jgi:Response regulator containing a CheY-like receiver domain and an HTH DNA-binding domain
VVTPSTSATVDSAPATPVRVALLNDYEVVAHGLAAMMRRYDHQIEVVELSAGLGVHEHVDVALYDTFAQVQGDRVDLEDLVADGDIGHVVVFSWNVAPTVVRAALDRGVHGYLSKTLPAGQLVECILAIARGRVIVDTGEDDRIAGGDWPGREEGLTAREAEVLALITQGLSNNDIAERTGVSINSVKSYIRSAYRRIGVTTRPTAILWGIEHGFRPDHMRVRNPHIPGSSR